MEGNRPPPGVLGPDRHDAEPVVPIRQRVDDARRELAVGEERLGVAGRQQLQLAVGAQLGERVQRPAVGPSRPEGERPLQLVAPRVRAPFAGQEPVRMLTRRSQILRELCDGQTLGAEKCLPNIGILGHWLRV